jgi:hypothetical protein
MHNASGSDSDLVQASASTSSSSGSSLGAPSSTTAHPVPALDLNLFRTASVYSIDSLASIETATSSGYDYAPYDNEAFDPPNPIESVPVQQPDGLFRLGSGSLVPCGTRSRRAFVILRRYNSYTNILRSVSPTTTTSCCPTCYPSTDPSRSWDPRSTILQPRSTAQSSPPGVCARATDTA